MEEIMLKRLEATEIRFNEVEKELLNDNTFKDKKRYRDLSKERAYLSNVVDKYNEWKTNGFTHQPVINKEQFTRQHEAAQFEQLFIETLKH